VLGFALSVATLASILSSSSLARERRQGRTAPGVNQEGAAKMGVKFKKNGIFKFVVIVSHVSAYEALYLSLIAVYDT